MNIIILIIANDHPKYYHEMQTVWKKYMNLHPNIRSFFIKGNEEDSVESETIYVKSGENYIPGILEKTVKSMEYIQNNYEYDYIFRTNLSSFVDLYKLYEFIHLESTQSMDYGGIILTPSDIPFGYISGAGILFSRTTTEYIINNQSKLDYSIIDDVAFGKLLVPKFPIDFINRIELESVPECIIKPIRDSPVFHFRCKTTNHFNTVNIMNRLCQIVYG
jgi:hypothetical protein